MSCNVESSFEERLENAKAARSKSKEVARLSELQDQNNYLQEKIKCVKLHTTRNEAEIKRLAKTNTELCSLRDGMQHQISAMVGVVKSWCHFREEIIHEQRLWEKKIMENE
jgi:hypothetical protein|eukprot:scaffold797_cov408-Chaetoceros_neogracile.AAC.45